MAANDQAILAIQESTRQIKKNQLKALEESTDRIIASNEWIREEISRGVDRVVSGLDDLGAAFAWGCERIVYHLELQREELRKIIHLLETPLETQARELRKRAKFASLNGWLDEALTDLLEAEKKNYSDFTIHQMIGNIYSEKGELDRALEYYEKAAKYALPQLKSAAGYAQWHIAHVKYRLKDTPGAYEAICKAIELDPTLLPAHFDKARYCALINRGEESIRELKISISGDRGYCIEAHRHNDFSPIHSQVGQLMEDLHREARKVAQTLLASLKDVIETLRKAKAEEYEPGIFRQIEKARGQMGELIRRDSYFDLLDAQKIAKKSRELAFEAASKSIQNQIDNVSAKLVEKKNALDRIESKFPYGCLGWIAFFFCFVIVGGLMGFQQTAKGVLIPIAIAIPVGIAVPSILCIVMFIKRYESSIKSFETTIHQRFER